MWRGLVHAWGLSVVVFVCCPGEDDAEDDGCGEEKQVTCVQRPSFLNRCWRCARLGSCGHG